MSAKVLVIVDGKSSFDSFHRSFFGFHTINNLDIVGKIKVLSKFPKELFLYMKDNDFTHLISYRQKNDAYEGFVTHQLNDVFKVEVLRINAEHLRRKNENVFKPQLLDYLQSHAIGVVNFKEGDEPLTKVIEIDTKEKFYKLIKEIKREGILTFDFETSGLEPYKEHFYPTLLQISIRTGESYVIPLTPVAKNDLRYAKFPSENELAKLGETIYDEDGKKWGNTYYTELYELFKDGVPAEAKLKKESQEFQNKANFWQYHVGKDFTNKKLIEGKDYLVKEETIAGKTIEVTYNVGSLVQIHSFSNEDISEMMEVFGREILQNPDIRLVAHNLKYDMHVYNACFYYDFKLGRPFRFRCQVSDTYTLQRLLWEHYPSYSLASIVDRLIPQFGAIKDVTAIFNKKGAKYLGEGNTTDKRFDIIPYEVLFDYGAIDTDTTLRVHTLLYAELIKDYSMYRNYESLNMWALTGVFEMEANGYYIDLDRAEEVNNICEDKIKELRQKIMNHPTVRKFNMDRKKQAMQKALKDITLQEEKAKGIYTNKKTKYDELLKLTKENVTKFQKKYEKDLAHQRRNTHTDLFGQVTKPKIDRTKLDTYLKKLKAIEAGSDKVTQDLVEALNKVRYIQKKKGEVRNPSNYLHTRLDLGKDDFKKLLYSKDYFGFEKVFTIKGAKLVKVYEKVIKEYQESGFAPKTIFVDGKEKKIDIDKVLHTDFDILGVAKGKEAIPKLKETVTDTKISDWLDTCLEYFSYVYTYSTVMDKQILKNIGKDGKLHPTYNIGGTKTGRFSSSKPNAQNFPSRGIFAKLVKSLFRSKIYKSLIAQCDLSQAEYRVAGDLSEEISMIEIYLAGRDLHMETGKVASGLSDEDWDKLPDSDKKSYRQSSKKINFGVLYGMSKQTLYKELREVFDNPISEAEFNKIWDSFTEARPYLMQYCKDIVAFAKQNGYVETLFGKKSHLVHFESPNDTFINSPDKYKASAWERKAVNYVVQGTVGEYTAFAIGMAHRVFIPDTEISLCGTIHDSILPEAPENKILQCKKVLVHIYENLAIYETFGKRFMNVPMKADFEGGVRWSEMKEI